VAVATGRSSVWDGVLLVIPAGLAVPRATIRRRGAGYAWRLTAGTGREGGCIPDDPELVSELAAPIYKFDAQGRRQVESKDELKKRGLPSPDKADALVMTFGQPVAIPDERELLPGARPRNIAEHEYDPFSDQWRAM
jgi:hypothetical protein